MIETNPLQIQILATLLVEGRRGMALVPDLSVSDFTSGPLRDVYAAMSRLEADGTEVSFPTVGAELAGNSKAIQALAGFNDPSIPSQLPTLAKQLKTAVAIGNGAKLAARIKALAEAEQSIVNLGERLDEMQRLGTEIVQLGAFRAEGEDVLYSVREAADAEVRKLEKALMGESPPPPLKTGIPKLDKMVRLEGGMLFVIGGVTGSGKSSLCGTIASHLARDGYPVVFVTSEMTHREMLYRITAPISGTPISVLREADAALEASAIDAYAAIGDLPIYFQRHFPPRMDDAKAAIRTGVARHGAKVAIVDYAQRLAQADDDRHEQAIAAVARECKNLALELGILVIAAAQVNRQPAGRRDPRPLLSDLRGSGEIEQNADVVCFTHQPKNYGKTGGPQIIVAKQRNGATGEVDVFFNEQLCTFGSY